MQTYTWSTLWLLHSAAAVGSLVTCPLDWPQSAVWSAASVQLDLLAASLAHAAWAGTPSSGTSDLPLEAVTRQAHPAAARSIRWCVSSIRSSTCGCDKASMSCSIMLRGGAGGLFYNVLQAFACKVRSIFPGQRVWGNSQGCLPFAAAHLCWCDKHAWMTAASDLWLVDVTRQA